MGTPREIIVKTRISHSLRWLCLVALLLGAAAPLAPAAQVQVAERYAESVRGTIDDLPFVVLRGTLEQRGEAFGALCGKDCARIMSTVILPMLQGKNQDGWQIMLSVTKAAFTYPADDEQAAAAFIRGYRKAVPPAERVIQPLGRELSEDDLKAFQGFFDVASAGLFRIGGCSSFSAWGELTADGAVITGRNLDYRTFPGQFMMMVVAQQPAEKDRLATIEVSGPGVIGASTAMNEQGVFVALHDEQGLPPSIPRGFCPRISALRQAVEHARAATAVEDVAATLRGKTPLMGGNVHVSMPMAAGKDSPRPSVVEWDGNAKDGGATIRAPQDDGALFCTNHFLARRPLATGATGDSQRRFGLLSDAAAATRTAKGKIDPEKAKAMLNSVARSGGTTTYLSVIAFPGSRRMMVAVFPKSGVPATQGHWVDVEWDQVFGAK
jgi:hypothetical protein